MQHTHLSFYAFLCLLLALSQTLQAEPRPLETKLLAEKTDRVMQRLEEGIKKDELLLERTKEPTRLDRCVKSLAGKNSFGERITYFAQTHLAPREVFFDVGSIASDPEGKPLNFNDVFGLNTFSNPVGLASHPLCEMNSQRFYRSVGNLSRVTVTEADKKAAKIFIQKFNLLQDAAQENTEGDKSDDKNITKNVDSQLRTLAKYVLEQKPVFIGLAVFKEVTKESIATAEDIDDIKSAYKIFQPYLNKREKLQTAKGSVREKLLLELGKHLQSLSIKILSRSFNIGLNKIPDLKTIERVNQFAKEHNSYRTQSRSKDTAVKTLGNKRMTALWSNLFHCIAYAESLTDPDSEKAKNLADMHYPKDENGSAGKQNGDGIEWYMDLQGHANQRHLAVGLFQFSPESRANQLPCVKAWNNSFAKSPADSGCVLDPYKTDSDGNKKWSKKKMLDAIAGSLQTYNASCGVNKVVQSFYIQVNSTELKRSHILNKISDERLKAPTDRCVSPHFRSDLTFNHFGPLQNSTGTNLFKVMACVYGDS